jgi:hypothetical protein
MAESETEFGRVEVEPSARLPSSALIAGLRTGLARGFSSAQSSLYEAEVQDAEESIAMDCRNSEAQDRVDRCHRARVRNR